MKDKILVLDFDGVLVDSTPECLETSCDAWNQYNLQKGESSGLFERDNDAFRTFFTRVRPLVRGGGEYLVLYKCWLMGCIHVSRDQFYEVAQSCLVEQEIYSEIFYRARSERVKKDHDAWCRLHTPKRDLMSILASKIESSSAYIATLKDRYSVTRLLTYYGIPFDDTKILDKDEISSKLDALQKIERREGVVSADLVFIDDNPLHLIPLSTLFPEVYMSTWFGCNSEALDLAKKHDIKTISDPNDLVFKSQTWKSDF